MMAIKAAQHVSRQCLQVSRTQEAEMRDPAMAPSAADRPAQAGPLGDVVAQSQALFNGIYETCGGEGRAFMEDWARDGAEAMRGVQAARSPLDLFAVQQKWWLARGCAWIDAGARLLAGPSLLAEDSVSGFTAFRLPE
jgi:hypothetical protein